MSSSPDPKQNHLLAALRAADYARLLPDLELTPMALGSVVYEAGTPMDYVYFPTTCIISLLYVMENGDSAEIAIIGNDGLVGVSVFMGGDIRIPACTRWAVLLEARGPCHYPLE